MRSRRDEFNRNVLIRRSVKMVADDAGHHHPAPPLQHRPAEMPEVIFGFEPVREMVAAAPSRIRALYVKQGTEGRFERQIRAVREVGGRVGALSSKDLARLAGREGRHQGIIAVLREFGYTPLEQVLAGRPDPLVLVDGVTDPRNLGALLRAAECAGIGAVVLAKDRTAGLTPVAIKASAGASAHLRLARCGNVAQTLEWLKAEGYWIAALDARGDTSLYEVDVSRRLALLVGSEGPGLRPIVRKTADFLVKIPMYGRISSLNVSVAAAVALFEFARRRAFGGHGGG